MEINRFKDRYDYILGFAALVVSLSAFKDELKSINLTFGTSNYNLGQYFLIVICGFLICLYLYSIEKIFRNYSIGRLRLFSIILVIAEIVFIFIIVSPVILISVHLGFQLLSILKEIPIEKLKTVSNILQPIALIINILVAVLTFVHFNRLRKEKRLIELEEDEIKDLEIAYKLLKDGYYSQSILESFKVVETHLFKKLTQKNIRVSRQRINDLIKAAIENGVITENDLLQLNNIREMRNIAAHLDTNYTKGHAEKAYNFIKTLIKNNDPNNES